MSAPQPEVDVLGVLNKRKERFGTIARDAQGRPSNLGTALSDIGRLAGFAGQEFAFSFVDTLGIPGELLEYGLETLGVNPDSIPEMGIEGINALAAEIGMTRAVPQTGPERAAARIGNIAGIGAQFLIPILNGARALQLARGGAPMIAQAGKVGFGAGTRGALETLGASSKVAEKAARGVQTLRTGVSAPFVSAPGRNVALETALAVPAGIAGQAAEEAGFGPGGQMMAELFGVAAPVAAVGAVAGTTSRAARAGREMVTGGGRARGTVGAAGDEFRASVSDPALARTRMYQNREVQAEVNRLLEEAGATERLQLRTSQMTGDPGIATLERDLGADTATGGRILREDDANVSALSRALELLAPPEGEVANVAIALQRESRDFMAEFDELARPIRARRQAAEEALPGFGGRPEDASAEFTEELVGLARRRSARHRELFEAVDPDGMAMIDMGPFLDEAGAIQRDFSSRPFQRGSLPRMLDDVVEYVSGVARESDQNILTGVSDEQVQAARGLIEATIDDPAEQRRLLNALSAELRGQRRPMDPTGQSQGPLVEYLYGTDVPVLSSRVLGDQPVAISIRDLQGLRQLIGAELDEVTGPFAPTRNKLKARRLTALKSTIDSMLRAVSEDESLITILSPEEALSSIDQDVLRLVTAGYSTSDQIQREIMRASDGLAGVTAQQVEHSFDMLEGARLIERDRGNVYAVQSSPQPLAPPSGRLPVDPEGQRSLEMILQDLVPGPERRASTPMEPSIAAQRLRLALEISAADNKFLRDRAAITARILESDRLQASQAMYRFMTGRGTTLTRESARELKAVSDIAARDAGTPSALTGAPTSELVRQADQLNAQLRTDFRRRNLGESGPTLTDARLDASEAERIRVETELARRAGRDRVDDAVLQLSPEEQGIFDVFKSHETPGFGLTESEFLEVTGFNFSDELMETAGQRLVDRGILEEIADPDRLLPDQPRYRLTNEARQLAQNRDLTPTQLEILRSLPSGREYYGDADVRPATLEDLYQRVAGVNPDTVSEVVRGLEERGYLSSVADGGYARSFVGDRAVGGFHEQSAVQQTVLGSTDMGVELLNMGADVGGVTVREVADTLFGGNPSRALESLNRAIDDGTVEAYSARAPNRLSSNDRLSMGYPPDDRPSFIRDGDVGDQAQARYIVAREQHLGATDDRALLHLDRDEWTAFGFDRNSIDELINHGFAVFDNENNALGLLPDNIDDAHRAVLQRVAFNDLNDAVTELDELRSMLLLRGYTFEDPENAVNAIVNNLRLQGRVRVASEASNFDVTLGPASRGQPFSAAGSGAAASTEPSNRLQSSVEHFLAASASHFATKTDGSLDPVKYARWLDKNRPGIEEFSPGLLSRFDSLQRAQTTLDRVIGRREQSLKEFQESTAQLFIDQTPKTAIQKIMKSQDPELAMAELTRRIRRNGPAMAGLRRGFWDVFRDLSTAHGDTGFKSIFSNPTKAIAFLDNNETIAKMLWGQRRLDRMRVVLEAAELARSNAAPRSQRPVEFTKAAEPPMSLTMLLSRMYGAARGAVGMRFVRLEFAARALQRTIRLLDRSQRRQLLEDALFDDDVAEILMTPITPRNQERIARRIHLYLAEAGLPIKDRAVPAADEEEEQE